MDDCRYWEAGWKLVKAFSPPTPMVHPGCAAILERRYDLVRPKPAVKATLHVRTIRSCIFLVLFVLAAAACIYLSITMSRRVQRGINRWRDEEMQSLETQLRDLANADVRIQIERWKQQHEQEIRLDAIQRSSAVTRVKVTEHIVPYLPGFDLDPKDIRFLGTPIDLIAFKTQWF
jgi:hypothetical protein